MLLTFMQVGRQDVLSFKTVSVYLNKNQKVLTDLGVAKSIDHLKNEVD